MDMIDKKILFCLQKDASMSISEVSERVNLSQTPCWRRIQNLEKAGVIKKRVAILARDKINVGVTVFVSLKTRHHNPDWLEKFARTIVELPEVVEFYRMSGDVDYLLKIVTPDIAAYDAVYKRLIGKIDLDDVSSTFAMEEIKYETALPLDYVLEE